jgi:hypothetical protein
MSKVKKFYIANIKGFHLNQLCAATLVFEGTKEQVAAQEKMVYETAKKHGGVCASFLFLPSHISYLIFFILATAQS